MINLNNKGMTIVEILVCFLLVGFISSALFGTVETFTNRRNIESVKADLIQYRNEIDKLIEDDLIHKGLINADVYTTKKWAKPAEIATNLLDDTPDEPIAVHQVKLYFRDGDTRELVIYSQRAGDYGSNKDDSDSSCTGNDDEFFIAYGKSAFDKDSGSYIKYPLPDVGEFENTTCVKPSGGYEIIKDLRFNTIKVSKDNNVLFIYINFYHPELGNDYSINIVAPMNYFA